MIKKGGIQCLVESELDVGTATSHGARARASFAQATSSHGTRAGARASFGRQSTDIGKIVTHAFEEDAESFINSIPINIVVAASWHTSTRTTGGFKVASIDGGINLFIMSVQLFNDVFGSDLAGFIVNPVQHDGGTSGEVLLTILVAHGITSAASIVHGIGPHGNGIWARAEFVPSIGSSNDGENSDKSFHF